VELIGKLGEIYISFGMRGMGCGEGGAGLDISNDGGGVKGKMGRWRGERSHMQSAVIPVEVVPDSTLFSECPSGHRADFGTIPTAHGAMIDGTQIHPDDSDREILAAMAWAKPKYGKGKIDAAGEMLLREDELSANIFDPEFVAKYYEAVDIVNNWRASHSYPLQTIKMTLKRRAKRVCPTALVAQRLKRLASIKLKLNLSKQEGNHPNLSQMQDLGGCRAVLDSVRQVRKLEKLFSDASKKNPKRGPQHFKTSDYITNPKENGYRSVHLIYKFRTDSEKHDCYNGQRIEIQLRTRLQHYWATAVETYSTFTGEALKSNIGSEQWMRFFALVSSAIAIFEKQPTVPGTPTSMDEIRPEIQALYTSLNVNNVLSGWAATMKFTVETTDEQIKSAAMYLIVLDPATFSGTLYPYSKDQLAAANAQYAKTEKEQPDLQAVLVAVDSVAALRAAYPNYYLDTTSFLKVVNAAIDDTKQL
jgi:ppGpp synthetase/RelA/SpoT-type nucleotidyltranferase